jgi:hypothetical protein
MFRIELAYRFSRTPSELDATLLVSEYLLLATADGIEPRGEVRADLRAGIVSATIVNSNPWRKSGNAVKPADFMPTFGRRRKQDMQHLKAQLKAYTIGMGGEVREVKRGQ